VVDGAAKPALVVGERAVLECIGSPRVQRPAVVNGLVAVERAVGDDHRSVRTQSTAVIGGVAFEFRVVDLGGTAIEAQCPVIGIGVVLDKIAAADLERAGPIGKAGAAVAD